MVDAARAESELRLDLAELLEQERAYADALALVDAVQPLDNTDAPAARRAGAAA